MLDRKVVANFLREEIKDAGICIPKRIDKRKLVEAFCRFTEDDYYEWLKDNFKSFFNHGNPDWDWIEEIFAKVECSKTQASSACAQKRKNSRNKV